MERDTAQRRAIRRVFEECQRPLSPAEVLEAAQGEVPSLGIATVYRFLKALVQEDWLVPVELPGEPQRYERSGKDHHHHFSCRLCGRLFDFEGCPDNIEKLVPQGFTMEHHELYIYGRCQDCRQARGAS